MCVVPKLVYLSNPNKHPTNEMYGGKKNKHTNWHYACFVNCIYIYLVFFRVQQKPAICVALSPKNLFIRLYRFHICVDWCVNSISTPIVCDVSLFKYVIPNVCAWYVYWHTNTHHQTHRTHRKSVGVIWSWNPYGPLQRDGSIPPKRCHFQYAIREYIVSHPYIPYVFVSHLYNTPENAICI